MNTIEVNGKIESLRKETEDIKKSQMKNLEMKNTSVKIKILLDGLSSRMEMMDLNSNVPIIILNVIGLIDRPTAIINPLERLLSFVKNPNSLTCLILPDLLAAFDALIWLFEIVFSLGFRTITKFTSYLFIQYFCFAGFF